MRSEFRLAVDHAIGCALLTLICGGMACLALVIAAVRQVR